VASDTDTKTGGMTRIRQDDIAYFNDIIKVAPRNEGARQRQSDSCGMILTFNQRRLSTGNAQSSRVSSVTLDTPVQYLTLIAVSYCHVLYNSERLRANKV